MMAHYHVAVELAGFLQYLLCHVKTEQHAGHLHLAVAYLKAGVVPVFLQAERREVFYGFCYVLYFKHLISHYALYVNP